MKSASDVFLFFEHGVLMFWVLLFLRISSDCNLGWNQAGLRASALFLISAWKIRSASLFEASNVKGLYYYKYNVQFSLEKKKSKCDNHQIKLNDA
jgi:hypothetical protein